MSTNPEDILEEVVGEGREEGTNPFLEDALGGDPDHEEDEERARATFLGLSEGEPGPPERFTAGGAFAQGVKEGTLAPLSIFGVDVEEETGRPIAEMVGELTGFGISFLPFFAATRVGLAAGLARTGLAGRVSPLTMEALEGGLSFGLFEAGVSEEVEDIPEHFAFGAVFGAVGDPLLRRGLGKIFGRTSKEVRSGDPPFTVIGMADEPTQKAVSATRYITGETIRQLPSPGMVRPHPDQLRLERMLHPENSLTAEEIGYKVAKMGDADKALGEVVGELASVHRPGGSAIISGLRSPKEIVPHLKKNVPDAQVAVRQTEDGLFDVWVLNGVARDSKVAEIEGFAPVRKVISKGERVSFKSFEEAARWLESAPTFDVDIKRVTLDQISKGIVGAQDDLLTRPWKISELEPPQVKAVLDDVWSDMIAFVRKNPDASDAMEYRALRQDLISLQAERNFKPPAEGRRRLGEALYDPAGGTIWVADDLPREMEKIETLAHEYTHLLTSDKSRGKPLIEYVFTDLDATQQHQMRREMIDATVEILTRAHMERGNLPRGPARKLATDEAMGQIDRETRTIAEWIMKKGNHIDQLDDTVRYYHREDELMSRLVELMFIDPAQARKIAPLASEQMESLIREMAPRFHKMVSKDLRNFETAIIPKRTGETQAILGQVPWKMTKRMRKQFKETGFAEGLEVLYKGQSKAFVGNQRIIDGRRMVDVMDPFTRTTQTVPLRELHRPTIPKLMQRNKALDGFVRKLVERGPQGWVGVTMRNGDDFFKGFVNTEGYREVESLGTFWGENVLPTLDNVTDAAGIPTSVRESQTIEYLRRNGIPGLVQKPADSQIPRRLAIADPTTVNLGQRLGGHIEGPFDDVFGNTVELTHHSIIEGMLRQARVPEREIPYFMDIAEDQFKRKTLNTLDDETVAAVKKANEVAAKTSDELADAGARSGLLVKEETQGGRYRVLDGDSRDPVAGGLEQTSALEYVNRAGNGRVGSVLEHEPIPTGFASGGGKVGGPPKPPQSVPTPGPEPGLAGEDAGFLTRLFDSFSLFFKNFTAMENFAKAAERNGLGPAYNKVFITGQNAIEAANREYAEVAQSALGGKSFFESLEKIGHKLRALSGRERKELVDYIEFMTKEEIEKAGGMLQRGMNDFEIKVSNQIQSLGLAEDLPRLQATQSLMKNMIDDAAQFRKKANDMLRQDISDDMRQTIQTLKRQADEVPEDFGTLLDNMEFSKEEKYVLSLIDTVSGRGPENLSWAAIGRHTVAPELPKGFSSGREWFASQRGFTKLQRQTAEEMEQHLKAVFANSGLDARRELGGYWPHMRKYVEAGGEGWAEQFMRQYMPESVEWSHRKLRTGELDIYNKNPAQVLYKYTRGLVMEKHFDEALPIMKEGLAEIPSTRVKRVMGEYVDELLGKPHASFQKLEAAVRESMAVFGIEVEAKTAEKLINNLTALTYGATIPFRPALIMRNFYQMVQTISPRTGGRDFWGGLQTALTEEGRMAAIKGGAIPAMNRPVHAGSEIFDKPGQAFDILSNLSERGSKLFRKGFDWYRAADDLGRATAFHAQRRRISRHASDFFNDKISYQEMKRRAGIKTFDELDEARFDQLWADKQYEQAKDWLGRSLARETIFRYGHANHPAGWGGIAGRLLGQFGTWPVQYKDFLMQGMRRGTRADKARFAAWHGVTNVATVAGGAAVGLDTWNWVTFPSLQYTGGPFADIGLNLVQVVGGSDQERSMALNDLKWQLPSLENPASIFIPGSYAVADIVSATQQSGGVEAAAEGLGFKLLRPDEKTILDYIIP